jgi:hypothetical protein
MSKRKSMCITISKILPNLRYFLRYMVQHIWLKQITKEKSNLAKIEKVSKFLGVVITTTTTIPIWILYTWKNTYVHNPSIPISHRKETLYLQTHRHIPYQHILARNGQWTQCVWVCAKIDSWYKNPKLAKT